MKKIIIWTIIVVLFQIIISFITENQIVSNSFSYHQNYLALNELKKQNQILTNQLLHLTSLYNLKNQTYYLQLFPINKTLDLTK